MSTAANRQFPTAMAALAAVLGVFASVQNAAGNDAGEAPDEGFGRYQSIIDRMPFGEPPPGFDPALVPGSAAAAAAAAAAGANGAMTEEQRSEEEKRLASSVRVSVLNVTPSGRVMAGFTDSSAKPQAHYYLPVGGSRDGWTVKAADPAAESVTLEKGGVEVVLKLGEGPSGAKEKDAGGRKNPQAVAAAAPASEAVRGAMGGYFRRRQELRKLEEEKRKAEAAALVQREEKAQEAEERANAAAENAQLVLEQLSSVAEGIQRDREIKNARGRKQSAETAGQQDGEE